MADMVLKRKESPSRTRVTMEISADASQMIAEMDEATKAVRGLAVELKAAPQVRGMTRAVKALRVEIEKLDRVARRRLDKATRRDLLSQVLRRVLSGPAAEE